MSGPYEQVFTDLRSVHAEEKVVISYSDRQEECLCFCSLVSAGCVCPIKDLKREVMCT